MNRVISYYMKKSKAIQLPITLTAISNQSLAKQNASFATARTSPADNVNNSTTFACVKPFNYQVIRKFNNFNTTLIPGTVTSANLYVFNPIVNLLVNSGIAQLANITTLTTNDFNNFSTVYGIGTENIIINTHNYLKIPLNASAISKINEKTNFWIAVREYDKDYLNVAPTSGDYYSSTTYPSYLELIF